MLLEIEPFGIDQQSAHRATLVIRPMIIHMQIEIVQIAQKRIAFDAIQGPNVILDLVLIVSHWSLVSVGITVVDEFLLSFGSVA